MVAHEKIAEQARYGIVAVMRDGGPDEGPVGVVEKRQVGVRAEPVFKVPDAGAAVVEHLGEWLCDADS